MSTQLKTVVPAAMPIASVNTATSVSPRLRQDMRMPYLRSCKRVGTVRLLLQLSCHAGRAFRTDNRPHPAWRAFAIGTIMSDFGARAANVWLIHTLVGQAPACRCERLSPTTYLCREIRGGPSLGSIHTQSQSEGGRWSASRCEQRSLAPCLLPGNPREPCLGLMHTQPNSRSLLGLGYQRRGARQTEGHCWRGPAQRRQAFHENADAARRRGFEGKLVDVSLSMRPAPACPFVFCLGEPVEARR